MPKDRFLGPDAAVSCRSCAPEAREVMKEMQKGENLEGDEIAIPVRGRQQVVAVHRCVTC